VRELDSRSVWEQESALAGYGDLRGYAVAASDGPVGEVVACGDDPGREYVIAAAGPALEGDRVVAGAMAVLPVGLVERVDPHARVVVLAVSRAEVSRAPAFEADRYQDGAYLAELSAYYGSLPQFDGEGTG
jgi:hypothetical protein